MGHHNIHVLIHTMGCHNIYMLVHMLWDTIIFKCASPHGGHNIHVLLHIAAEISRAPSHKPATGHHNIHVLIHTMGCHNIYMLVHTLWDIIIYKCASPHGGHNIHVLLHMAAEISRAPSHKPATGVLYSHRLGLIFGLYGSQPNTVISSCRSH